jgi:hypothetical protein
VEECVIKTNLENVGKAQGPVLVTCTKLGITQLRAHISGHSPLPTSKKVFPLLFFLIPIWRLAASMNWPIADSDDYLRTVIYAFLGGAWNWQCISMKLYCVIYWGYKFFRTFRFTNPGSLNLIFWTVGGLVQSF